MNVKYKWHSVGSNSCYACTRWNGQIFNSIDAVPELPVHSNCKCYIEAIEPGIVKLERTAQELASSKASAEKDVSNIENALNSDEGLTDKVYAKGKEVLADLKQIYKTLDIFWDNYNDMKETNTIGADKYFHSKANAESAQLGKTAEKTAKLISDIRESIDVYKNILVRKMSFEEAMKDGKSDLTANEYGRKVGREHPTGSMEEFLKRYRPKSLGDKY